MTRLQIIFAFGFLVLIGCKVEDSADVNQDRIHVHYELFYNQNDDKTIALARFRFGNAAGTLLQLNADASVRFNGNEMAYNAWYLGHMREFAGKVDSGSFVYNDLDGMVFTNVVGPLDTIAFPADFDTIVKSQANTLTWVGNPLAPTENVGLFIGSWAWGDDALYLQSADNATEIVMGTNQLSNVPAGISTVYMDRWTDVPATEVTSRGGRMIGKYRAENRVVQVVN